MGKAMTNRENIEQEIADIEEAIGSIELV